MSTTPMSLAQFGQLIKSKHPEYQDLGDEDLGTRVLAKYPQYKDMVASAPIDKTSGKPIPAYAQGMVDQSQPTQFEKDRPGASMSIPQQVMDFIKTTGKNLIPSGGAPTPYSTMGATNPAPFQKMQQGEAQALTEQRQFRKDAGYNPVYRAVAEVAPIAMVNPAGAEQAAAQGRTGGVLGNTVGPPAAVATIAKVAPLVAKGVAKGAEVTGRVLPASVEELTGTTPNRISELQSFPQKIEGIRQQVITAEKSAHQAASDAFPKFDKPIETGRMIEKPASGPIGVDDFGEIAPKALEPETTTFKALQEQRSTLLKDIAAEKRAINAGMKPRFDLENMVGELNRIDGIMEKAALEQGGQVGLDQLNTARVQYGKYMNDFHNAGSPLRKVLDAKPGEVNKIVGNFLNPDNGARGLETLKQYGVDTSNIQSMLGQGERPLKVTAAESSKLRKAGSPEAYTVQRLRESLSQARTNELPSTAQARLPQSAMKSKYPLGVLNEIPGAEYLTPRKITELRLKAALKARGQKP